MTGCSRHDVQPPLERAKLHYTDTGYEVRTPATNTRSTDELTTNSPPADKNLPHPNILTVEMLGSGIAMWQICCRIVASLCTNKFNRLRTCRSLSVGGVRSWCPCSGVWAKQPVTARRMTCRRHNQRRRIHAPTALLILITKLLSPADIVMMPDDIFA